MEEGPGEHRVGTLDGLWPTEEVVRAISWSPCILPVFLTLILLCSVLGEKGRSVFQNEACFCTSSGLPGAAHTQATAYAQSGAARTVWGCTHPGYGLHTVWGCTHVWGCTRALGCRGRRRSCSSEGQRAAHSAWFHGFDERELETQSW